MAKPLYRECVLDQNGHVAIAWIRDNQAEIGQVVSLPEVSGVWLVTKVGTIARTMADLRAVRAEEYVLPPRARIALKTCIEDKSGNEGTIGNRHAERLAELFDNSGKVSARVRQ